MQYFRNKEVKKISLLILFIAVVMTIISFLINIWAGLMVMVTVLLLCLVF